VAYSLWEDLIGWLGKVRSRFGQGVSEAVGSGEFSHAAK
jgi:hypothetical protein